MAFAKPIPQAEVKKTTVNPAVDESVVLYVDPAKRIPLVPGIFAVLLVGGLTTSALNTILPVIATEIGGLDLFSLVFIAASFGGVLFSPIAGGFINVVNRKNLFLISSALVIVTQIAHVFVPTMGMMVAVRALNAVCATFANITGLSLIAFIFPKKDRIRWLGFYGTMIAVGSFFGPVIGGFFTDNLSWQWFFYVTVAIAIVGFVVVAIYLPRDDQVNRKAVKVDWSGLLFYGISLMAALYLISFGGKAFDWASITTLGLVIAVVIAGFAFVKVEQRKDERAMMPMSLFRDSRFTLTFIAQFAAIGPAIPFFMYLSLYLQKVLGYTATNAGLFAGLSGVAAVCFSLVFAPYIAKTGLVKQSAFTALAVMTVISILTALAGFFSFYSLPLLVVVCIIYGCATPITTTVYIMIVQSALPKEVIGIATGNIQLAMSLGSMVSVAICGAILNGYGANLNSGISTTYLVGVAMGIFGLTIIALIKMPKKIGSAGNP